MCGWVLAPHLPCAAVSAIASASAADLVPATGPACGMTCALNCTVPGTARGAVGAVPAAAAPPAPRLLAVQAALPAPRLPLRLLLLHLWYWYSCCAARAAGAAWTVREPCRTRLTGTKARRPVQVQLPAHMAIALTTWRALLLLMVMLPLLLLLLLLFLLLPQLPLQRGQGAVERSGRQQHPPCLVVAAQGHQRVRGLGHQRQGSQQAHCGARGGHQLVNGFLLRQPYQVER